MKLLTLNTHSLQEAHYEQKLAWFVAGLLRERPDLVALQEVNQSVSAPAASPDLLEGLVPVPGNAIPVRWDNHAAQVACRLRRAGVPCSWTWLPVKLGYGKYDEGLALLALSGASAQVDAFPISRCRDYHNWKTRKALGLRLEGGEDWYYTVHMGWWGDQEEPFSAQWDTLDARLADKKAQGPVWLMGDFNSPAAVRGEGYDAIQSAGWRDTYHLAAEQDGGVTVEGSIDGWRDELSAPEGMRIDHIWCSRPVAVRRSSVLFNGQNGPRVSDHFGVLVETP